MSHLEAMDDHRIHTIFSNLLKIRAQQGEGIIFACGAFHAPKLLDEFKKQNMQDEVLYYFPHSASRYDNRVDDIQVSMNDTLLGHTYLLTQKEVRDCLGIK